MPGLNQIIDAAKTKYNSGKFSCSYSTGYSVMKKKMEYNVISALIRYGITPIKKASFKMLWFCKDRRKDPDNIASYVKFIFDAMVSYGTLENDGWNQVVGWKNIFVSNGSATGVIVTIQQEE